MKIYKVFVAACDDCPCMRGSPIAGGHFCLLTNGGATKLDNIRVIPEWCPLPDCEAK